MTGILSIQSWVAYGHAGNAAAVFPLQRLGFEVYAVNTVQFSNHTGYGAWRGQVFEAEAIREVIRGIGERGAFPGCRAVLTGYTGDVALGEVVLETVAAVKAANPTALWCCDPVMGDVGRGFFVRQGLPEYFRDRAVPMADIVTPNQFELEYLTGRAVETLADALAAVADLRRRGPRIVLVTSLRRRDAPAGVIEMLAADDTGTWLIATPELPIDASGAGDAVAALFLAYRLLGQALGVALSAVGSTIYAVLEETCRRQERELQLIAAQDAIVRPDPVFRAVRIGDYRGRSGGIGFGGAGRLCR
jgi:pyridoxine kinase